MLTSQAATRCMESWPFSLTDAFFYSTTKQEWRKLVGIHDLIVVEAPVWRLRFSRSCEVQQRCQYHRKPMSQGHLTDQTTVIPYFRRGAVSLCKVFELQRNSFFSRHGNGTQLTWSRRNLGSGTNTVYVLTAFPKTLWTFNCVFRMPHGSSNTHL